MGIVGAGAPHPFERHARIVLGVLVVLVVIGLMVVLGAGAPLGLALVAGIATLAIPVVVLWGLVTERWWAAAAAVGLFWAAILTGSMDVLLGLTHNTFVIPVGAIVCGLVLWLDRPSLTERGTSVAWIMFLIAVVLWAIGVLT